MLPETGALRAGAPLQASLTFGSAMLTMLAMIRSCSRLLPALLVVCGTAAHAQQASPASEVAQRVMACVGCHGKEGRATPDGYYPRIAGKPSGYLLNQMGNFRAGRRNFPTMIYFMQLREPRDLAQMADYFAGLRLPYPAPAEVAVAPQLLARGRQLANEGDARRGVPACRGCHGARLVGVAPDVPGLLGVSRDYLQAQLGAWRNGTRRAEPPDCMRTIANRLTPQDIGAVASWLASQTLPTDDAPAAGFTQRPALECGSIGQASRSQSQLQLQSQPQPQLHSQPQPTLPGAARAGEALAAIGDCQGCHTARGGRPFAGGRAIHTAFGVFYTPNITPDATSGIGRWTAEDFWHAMHDGYAPGNRLLYPSFPYTNYTRVSRSDVDAIFAYLRTRPAVAQVNRPHELRFPYSVRPLLALWRALYFRPGVYQPDAKHDRSWNRGAYLVQGLGHCSACHEARNALGATASRENPAGGLVLDWYAPSLWNPHEAGVQHWASRDIVTLLQTGQLASAGAPAATTIGPMAEVVYDSLQHLDVDELAAIAVYLKSLPATPPAAPNGRAVTPSTTSADARDLYQRSCAGCHGASGQGRAPLGPPLAGNRAVRMEPPTNAIRVMLFGGFPPGTAGDPEPYGMPPFYASLDDLQIASVLSYVRKSWGNAASAIRAEDVAANRGSPLW